MIIISRFSGKCDCHDSLIAISKYTDEELKNNVDIYIGNIGTPLRIESQKNLIPYYAHLVSFAYHNSDEKKAIINITSESWVDMEERELLEFRLECLLRIYNRCKRKKIEFNVDEAIKEILWNNCWNEDAYRELANRVKENGKKATIDGIHLKNHEYYRQALVNEMLENGLNPCKYGDYRRFIGDTKDESVE